MASEEDKRRREEGVKVKYVLEKTPDGWKLAAVYKWDYVLDGDRYGWRKEYALLTPVFPTRIPYH